MDLIDRWPIEGKHNSNLAAFSHILTRASIECGMIVELAEFLGLGFERDGFIAHSYFSDFVGIDHTFDGDELRRWTHSRFDRT
ncbi:MAG: hypothetical protein CMJ78_13135 [Planctomycetaceae bacterium]|nr:hypothetical protein [Planctomycetaceae bacterium]